jgi:hypothetical protein
MQKKKPKRPGANLPPDLKVPIQLELTTGIGLWGSRSLTRVEIAQQVAKKVAKRFDALMKHYRIPTNSSDKWTRLSFRLAEELGVMVIAFEQPNGPGAPAIWLKAGDLLIQRMEEIIAKHSPPNLEDAAKILIRQYPDDYKRLTAKSLANRYGEAKHRKEMSLSALLAEQRGAVGQRLRQLRAKRKRGPGPNAPSSWEKYFAAFLSRLQATGK